MASPENAAVTADEQLVVAPPTPARFSNRRAYAQTFAASLAVRILGVVSGILAARLLGPEGRGELAVIIFLPMLLAALVELELPRSLACEVSRVDEVSKEVMATGFWLAAALGFIQAVALAALLPWYLSVDKLHLLGASRWFMVYVVATCITATLMGSDQGRGRFGRFSFLLALPGGLYLLGILAAWATRRITPAAIAFGLLAATLVTAAVRIGMEGRAVLIKRPEWSIAQRLVKRGFGFYFPAVAGFLLARADMFIVVRLAPMDAVGLYAIAQAIALGQIGAVSPFVHVSFAAVAGETREEAAFRALAHHFRLAQLAALAAGLATAGFTPWIIRLLFGSEFLGAATATYLLIGGTALWGMSQVLEQGLRAAGRPQVGIVSNLLGLAIMFGIGVPACVRFGIKGVAAALLIAQLLNLGVLITFCIVRLKMLPREFWAMGGNNLKELKSTAMGLIGHVNDKAARFVWGTRP